MITTFVHLHLHTEFSLVDGLIRIKSLIKQVVAAGMPAVAVTDMNNLFAAIKFYKAARAAGIKPIIGAELWVRREVAEPARLVLLCQNLDGYHNLARLISRGYREGQQRGVPILAFDWLKGSTDSLIALSGGREGELGRTLLHGQSGQAQSLLADWCALFPDRFYLELQRTGRPEEEEYIQAAVELAAATDTPVVASNDVRFLKPEEFEAHEARVCIQEGCILSDPRRPRRYSEQQYLRTPAELAELFADLPEALENSVEIAIRCNLEIPLGKTFLPDFPIPAGMSMEAYFSAQARAGLERRLQKIIDPAAADFVERRRPYDERLEQELAVIAQMGFAGYFLIVADFIGWARAHQVPVGPGRGSGAGSLVAYALGITDLDPLPYDLLFERFLNPERVSMPDFDIDFCMEGRDRVIEYVAERYGRERVSQIATHGTMAAKAVIRDVGRVLGYPYGFVDRIAKMIPFELGITLDKALAQDQEFRKAYAQEEDVKTLVDLARSLEGLARNVGKHAGGVVIAPSELTDFSPLYCEEGATQGLVTQYDKDDVESVGLVKFDFLGLRTLTIIDWALQTINQQRAARGEEPLDIAAIPLDDAETFNLLKACKTTAVFQLESRGMKDLIKRLQPDRFEDIVALVALFRPGPLQSGMVDDFIDRKHGRAKVEYPHPALERVLKPTYGVILYQEQVMQIAQILANYTLGSADILRRCLAGSTQIVDVLTGRLVKLNEVAKEPTYWLGRQVFVLNLQTQKIAQQPITAIYPNGIQDLWEITTRTNRKIRATKDHLFYTLLGWQRLEDFKIGDCIGLARLLPITHSSKILDEQIKLTAYLLGDGHLCTKESSHSYFCNSDLELIDDFNFYAKKLFGRAAPINYQLHPGHKAVAYARIGFVTPFNKWIDSYIKRVHSRDKEIPEWVFSLSQSQLQLFLGTLWSTDGSFDSSIGHTDYNSTSEILIKQIQHLLLRVGIVSLFNVKRIQYQGKPHISYRTQVTGRDDMLRFCEMILPYLSRQARRKALQCYLLIKNKTYSCSKHMIPLDVISLIAEAKRASGMTWQKIDDAVGFGRGSMSSGLNFNEAPKRSLSRHRVLNFASALKNEELRKVAESEVFWDPIISIEHIGKEEVFDLSIPEDHNFIANDFIVHNCMGKKKPREMAEQRDIFLNGATKRGIEPSQANYIFDLMEKFASYGFNRSHSAAYALLSYQTAWLKTHYSAAFMAAVLSSDMDKTDKVVVFMEEARSMGLTILPPAINRSEYRFTVDDQGRIIYGLGAVKGVGEAAVEAILEERRHGGPFQDLFELCRRVDQHKLNRRVLESLIRAGAFDGLAPNRATLMAQLPEAMRLAEQNSRADDAGQVDLFGLPTVAEPVAVTSDVGVVAEWDQEQLLKGEKETLGLYLTSHPIEHFRAELQHIVTHRLVDLVNDSNGLASSVRRAGRNGDKPVIIAGLVVSVRTRTANRGGRMAFVTLDDNTARLEIRVFPEAYEQSRKLLVEDAILVIQGKLVWDDFAEGLRVNVDRVLDMDLARQEYARTLVLSLDASRFNNGLLEHLAATLALHRQGKCQIQVDYTRTDARASIILGQDWRVKPSEALLRELRGLVGEEKVRVVYS